MVLEEVEELPVVLQEGEVLRSEVLPEAVEVHQEVAAASAEVRQEVEVVALVVGLVDAVEVVVHTEVLFYEDEEQCTWTGVTEYPWIGMVMASGRSKYGSYREETILPYLYDMLARGRHIQFPNKSMIALS